MTTKVWHKDSVKRVITRIKRALENETSPAGRRQLEKALEYWNERRR